MENNKNKKWSDIQLINIRRKKAQINRLLKQDFLIFSEVQKRKFQADLDVLAEMEQTILKQLN